MVIKSATEPKKIGYSVMYSEAENSYRITDDWAMPTKKAIMIIKLLQLDIFVVRKETIGEIKTIIERNNPSGIILNQLVNTNYTVTSNETFDILPMAKLQLIGKILNVKTFDDLNKILDRIKLTSAKATSLWYTPI